jgi:uncharacterized protein YecE (DUF72 family)
MPKYLIGTGGWTYFCHKPTLKGYSKAFNFVEVNYTFYEYPNPRTVERWRRSVPPDFTFTVRCHQDLTHRIGLKPDDQACIIFSQMIVVCRILNAPFLHLLTPASYVFSDREIGQAKDFFSTISPKGIRLAWEVRSPMTPKLATMMQDFGIVHSADLSKEEPAFKSGDVYTRVFGKGEHNICQFDDEELEDIDQKIAKAEAKRVLVSFHGIRMNTDAARFKRYVETRTFIPVTAYTGIDSVKAVLQEDAEFPATRDQLIKHQGWKVVDLTSYKRVHLSELLSNLPEKAYHSVQEVTKEMDAILQTHRF